MKLYNSERWKKIKEEMERCDLCGKPADKPVARMRHGQIIWICANCWKKER